MRSDRGDAVKGPAASNFDSAAAASVSFIPSSLAGSPGPGSTRSVQVRLPFILIIWSCFARRGAARPPAPSHATISPAASGAIPKPARTSLDRLPSTNGASIPPSIPT